jgi:hypothetical protein
VKPQINITMNLLPRPGILALGLAFACGNPGLAAAESKPIADVRFDGPYRQIESSMGDEWAPTWGRDDVLYTGNDDGTSFGGIPENTIAFGKLEGADPNNLRGTTVSGMEEYREHGGPAQWQDLETAEEGGVKFKFASDCHNARIRLIGSRNYGRTWKVLDRAAAGFPCSEHDAPHFIRPREQLSDALGVSDAYAYAAFADPHPENAGSYYIGRVDKTRLGQGRPDEWTFFGEHWTPSLSEAMSLAKDGLLGPDGMNWKTMNTYSVDGVLYMFITRCQYPWESTDPKRRHVWQNASIIKSIDGGKTWERPGREDYAKPMFPGKRFATPYFVWYGKDGAASVDNADKYVYAVANDGFFENGDNYILGRVLRSKLPKLSGADWSFYKGEAGNSGMAGGTEDGSWTPSSDRAKPILINPGRSSMTGMTYIPGLRRYVMVLWHYHRMNFMQAIKDKDLGTFIEFFEAPKPWGPWTKVKVFDTGKLGWYAPIIGQRFQKTVNSDTVSAVLYATGFTSKPEGGLDPTLYKLDYLPITLSTKALAHNDVAFVGAR